MSCFPITLNPNLKNVAFPRLVPWLISCSGSAPLVRLHDAACRVACVSHDKLIQYYTVFTQTSILSHESMRSAARARPHDENVAARSRATTTRSAVSPCLICNDFNSSASEEVVWFVVAVSQLELDFAKKWVGTDPGGSVTTSQGTLSRLDYNNINSKFSLSSLCAYGPDKLQ